MPRLRRLALGLLLLPISASAQFEVSSIADPIRPDRSPLALTEEVPAIFWLGLDSPVPTFVNPARAARSKDRFVYATVRPAFALDRPVSFAALVGSRERKWLLTVENGVLVQEERRTDQSVRRLDLPDFSRLDINEQTRQQDLVATTTRARVVYVGRTDFGGIAFGLYGGYRSDVFDLTDEGDQTSTQESPGFEEESVRRSRTVRSSDTDAFGVGAEVAFAGRTWDLAAAVSYQRAVGETEVSANSFSSFQSEQDLGGTPFIQFRRTDEVSRSAADATPAAVDFEVVGALQAGRKRDDYLYASVAGTFGTGTADALATVERSELIRTTQNGMTTETRETSTGGGEDEVDLVTRATQASLGYVYAQRRRGLTILAAINPSGGFAHTESVAVGPFSDAPSRRETDVTTLALTLPLYVRFDVTRRLDAFGGGAYTYAYARTQTESRPVLLGDPPEGETRTETSERTVSTFISTGTLYAGAVFSFRSGLRAQASFRGNLAELTRWTVSLGYQF